jgi:hypothetical protein
LDLRNLIFPGGFRGKEQDKRTDLEITEKVKGLGAKPARSFSYLCSLQNRAGGGSSGQIAVGSGKSRLRQGAHGVEMIKGTKKEMLTGWGDGREGPESAVNSSGASSGYQGGGGVRSEQARRQRVRGSQG